MTNDFYYIKSAKIDGKLLEFTPITIICLSCRRGMIMTLEKNFYPQNFETLAEEVKEVYPNLHPNCQHDKDMPLIIVRRSDESEETGQEKQNKFNSVMYAD
jgi:hypothetical protein